MKIESMQQAAAFWLSLDWFLNHIEYPDSEMAKGNYKRVRSVCDKELSLLNKKYDEKQKY